MESAVKEAIFLLKRIVEDSTDAWARTLARQAIDALEKTA